MKIFLLASYIIAVSSALPSISEEWNSFKAKHGKSYSSPSEERYRYDVYLSNKEMVEQHNLKYEAGLVSYKLKLNHFSDKLPEEISAQMNGFNKNGELVHRKPGLQFTSPENFLAPSSIDWRQKGAVTPVKNQGHCGSCWAFSATGSIEGQLFRKTGKLVSLSEQNLVDCSGDYNNQGCNGGLMDQAFEYVKNNGGIDNEESYPYEGTDDEECRYRASESATSLRRYIDIPEGDEDALKNAVASVGPISVAINAGLAAFSHYGGGVFDNPQCDPATLNHGVLLVGYGSEDGQDYWLIKNSWSTTWGENGYVKIARNQNNLCGVASSASYPVV